MVLSNPHPPLPNCPKTFLELIYKRDIHGFPFHYKIDSIFVLEMERWIYRQSDLESGSPTSLKMQFSVVQCLRLCRYLEIFWTHQRRFREMVRNDIAYTIDMLGTCQGHAMDMLGIYLGHVKDLLGEYQGHGRDRFETCRGNFREGPGVFKDILGTMDNCHSMYCVSFFFKYKIDRFPKQIFKDLLQIVRQLHNTFHAFYIIDDFLNILHSVPSNHCQPTSCLSFFIMLQKDYLSLSQQCPKLLQSFAEHS